MRSIAKEIDNRDIITSITLQDIIDPIYILVAEFLIGRRKNRIEIRLLKLKEEKGVIPK